MQKKQKHEPLTPEKLAKIEALQKMMKDPKNSLDEKLKELYEMLQPPEKAMLLEEAAQKVRLSVESIKTIRASTKNDLEIFSETKGTREVWYIKIKKKQP